MHVVVIPHDFQDHYALGFANGLGKNGVSVDFVRSANMDARQLHHGIHAEDLGCNTESDIGVWEKTRRFAAYHARLIGFVARRRGALVHVIGLLRKPIFMGIVEGLIFRLLAAKYVLTVHNILPHDRHTTWNRLIHKTIYWIPDLLVVHTAKMKEELEAFYGVPTSRIAVMQHGLNDMVPDNGRSREECRALLGLPQDAFVLLFFGRIAPYKGVEMLLEAFGTDADRGSFLVIAGAPVDAKYGKRITEYVQSHPLRERILCHLRFIDDDEIATYFRASDGLVMPYQHIDQSGVLFLAFRFCLPVVAFDVGAMREYIRSGTGVLVEGGSKEALVAAIRRFRNDRQRYSAEQIFEDIHRYRWDRVLVPLIRAYELH